LHGEEVHLLQRNQTLQDTIVMVTRASNQSQRLTQLITQHGGIPQFLPLLKVVFRDNADIRKAVMRLGEYDALLATSVNSLRALIAAGNLIGVSVAKTCPVCYAVGRSTALMARETGMDCIIPPKVKTGLDLGVYMKKQFSASRKVARLLYPTGQLARLDVAKVLREAGHEVDVITCYDTIEADPDVSSWEQARASGLMLVVPLYSPSAVHTYVKHYGHGDRLSNGQIVHACIGQTTAEAAAAAGLHVHCVADTPSDESLLQAVGQYIKSRTVT
jgi:uroporphyrinogen-III synthase